MYDALKVTVEPTHRLVICRPSGIVDELFALQLLNFLHALEEVAEPFNRLLDLTGIISVPLENSEIYEYAEARREAPAQVPKLRTAIITSELDTEPAALLYSMLIKDSQVEVGVFPAASEAAQWLGIPEEIARSDAYAGPIEQVAN